MGCGMRDLRCGACVHTYSAVSPLSEIGKAWCYRNVRQRTERDRIGTLQMQEPHTAGEYHKPTVHGPQLPTV